MLFISATDTGVGKTYFSDLILKEALKHYDASEIAYFKPLQCGTEFNEKAGCEETDLQTIKRLNPEIDVFSSYEFTYPAAPILSAAIEAGSDDMWQDHIDISAIQEDWDKLKASYKFILVEGAGGLAVPINSHYYVSDLVKTLDLPLLLIARPDLGTINHSLLSIEHAHSKDLNLLGMIFAEQPAIAGPVITTAPEIIGKHADIKIFGTVAKFLQKLLP